MKKNKKLRVFLENFENETKTTLDGLFLSPVQRLPRYLMLFGEIKSACDDTELEQLFSKLQESIDSLLKEINSIKKWFDESKPGRHLVKKYEKLKRAKSAGVD
eukprot:UN27224